MYKEFVRYRCGYITICTVQVVKRTLISSGFNGSTEHISKELYDEFSGCSNWDIYDDVTLFLQTVKNAGCIVGVISNFDDRLGMFTIINSTKDSFLFTRLLTN